MKTNSWKITFMALAMATAMTGCNQNNELGTPSSEEDVLNVATTFNTSSSLLLRRVKKMY